MRKKRSVRTKQVLDLAKKKRGHDRRAFLLEQAGNRCCLCGFDRPWALEFHHVKQKRFTLNSRTLGVIADMRLILSEADRCVLLCSNCHKGVHGGHLTIERG